MLKCVSFAKNPKKHYNSKVKTTIKLKQKNE